MEADTYIDHIIPMLCIDYKKNGLWEIFHMKLVWHKLQLYEWWRKMVAKLRLKIKMSKKGISEGNLSSWKLKKRANLGFGWKTSQGNWIKVQGKSDTEETQWRITIVVK